jgi:hypothetical protein
MVKPLPARREYSADRATAANDQSRQDLTRALGECPFLRGKLVSVFFATGGVYQTITHGLGVLGACIVVRQNYAGNGAGPTFAENGSTSGLDVKNQISIAASAICTVDFWFYPRASKPVVSALGQSNT